MTDNMGKVEFYRPYLVLCEGVGDRQFLYALIRHHNIPPEFDIYDCGGRSGFHTFLQNHSIAEDFIQNVRAVLVISDNDDAGSLGEVRAELTRAEFPSPETAGTVATGKDKPKVVIYMLPHNEHGNLEHLCLPPAYAKWDYVEEPINAIVEATPVHGWSVGKRAKMRMQTLLSIVNDSQPDCGFGAIWRQPEQYRIPVGSPGFANLVQFLTDFPTLVAA